MSDESARAGHDPAPTKPTLTDHPAANPDGRDGKNTGQGRLATILGVLNLVLIALLVFAGLWAWQRLLDQQQAAGRELESGLDRELQNIHRQTGRLEAGLNERLNTLDQRQQDLADRQSALRSNLDEIRIPATHDTARDTTDWVLAEAAYLMQIANHRLRLQGDPQVAGLALQTADERLRDLADPALTPVRRELAREITALKNMPAPDREGLSLRLDGLAGQIRELPQRHTLLDRPPAANENQPADSQADGWDRALGMAWGDLKDLVRIRRHDQPAEALLSPKERFFLYQNLRLRLNSARLHLLERNADLLQSDLTQARTLLETYFDQQHPGVRNTLEELRRIGSIQIDPPLPDISASLSVLRRIIAERGREPDAAQPEAPATSTDPDQ